VRDRLFEKEKLSEAETMNARMCLAVGCAMLMTAAAQGQSKSACEALKQLTIPGVKMEISRAELLPAGIAPKDGPWSFQGPLPERCQVEGVLNKRVGVDGKPYGIRFAFALPSGWNRDFLMQGGGGANGVVGAPIGATAAADKPALTRGFAVASNDTGHQGGGFDFGFMKDEQASLDFAYEANHRVADVAKQFIAAYYGKPAAHSYFIGCSTGGREGMILTQRYPDEFDGVVTGSPARRTGDSNIASGPWAVVAYNQAAPKDADGKPIIAQALSDGDRKLVINALLKRCDARDGVVDGMIFDPLGCDFDPAELECKGAKDASCLSSAQVKAIKTAFGGPKNLHGDQVYPGYLYDTGVAAKAPIPGMLAIGRGIFGPPTTAMTIDVDQMAKAAEQPLVDALSTNLTTFSGHGGKQLFYHGDSDPWFSALDTLGYYKAMAAENGGLEKVSDWSRFFFVPGMGHCGGGEAALDNFDMLGAIVNWVEKGVAPQSVEASGKAFPGRTRPLCAYPKHAQYKGSGDTEKAENFECK
jgi:feruloyl esterase